MVRVEEKPFVFAGNLRTYIRFKNIQSFSLTNASSSPAFLVPSLSAKAQSLVGWHWLARWRNGNSDFGLWASRDHVWFHWSPQCLDGNFTDNHNDVISHLEPDILECEVKWALESITTNKASAGDGIPVELFQILKDDAVKVLPSICQQIWKTQQWPQDWKTSVFIPIPKKGNAKECSNYHTIALI